MGTASKSTDRRSSTASRLRKLARARAVTAACHRVMVRSGDELGLLREICRVAAREGGYALAWAGLVRYDEARTVEVVAGAGKARQYFKVPQIPISWADNELGRGPTGRAVRTRKPQIIQDVAADPDFAPWLQTVRQRGFASAATFPLICDDEVIGVFGIFGARRQTLDREEVALLQELSNDIAYGYRSLRSRRAQVEAEQHLLKLVRARKVMSECNRALAHAEDEQHVFDEVCRILSGPGGYQATWIGIVEHDREKSVKPAAHAGFPPGYFESPGVSWSDETPNGRGPAGRAVRTGEPQLEREEEISRSERRWKTALGGQGRGAALHLPIKQGREVVAVLGVVTGEQDPFDNDEFALLEQLAGDIEHAREVLLAREVQRQAEARIAESERRFSATFELAPVGINHISPGGEILLANSHFERLLGRAHGELVGSNIREFHLPEDRDLHRRLLNLRAQLHGGAIDRFVTEMRYGRRDGTTVWVELTVTLVRDADGKPLYDLSTAVDISERKRMEAELRSSEQRFRAMTLLASEWYWETDQEYRVTVLQNQTLDSERMNIIAKANLGRTHWEMPALNMDEASWDAHRARLDRRETFHDLVIKRMGQRTGQAIYLSMSGEPVFDADARFLGYRGIAKDISERVRVEQLQNLEHAVAGALGRTEDARSGIVEVIRTFCEIDGWECGRYFELDAGAGELRYGAAWGIDDAPIQQFIERSAGYVFKVGEALIGEVGRSGKPVWSADIQQAPVRRPGFIGDSGIHGAFSFPVLSEGHVLGVVSLSSREKREPDQRVLRAVDAIGSQVGQFLQRKQAEERARSQTLQQRVIAEFGRQALANVDVGDIMRQAVHLIASTLRAEFCEVLEIDADRTRLTYKAAVGRPQEWIGERSVPIVPHSQVAYVLARGEPVIVEDYSTEPRFAPSPLLQFGIRSGVQVPIHGPASLFGLLGVQTAELRRFTPDEVSFLDSMGNILAVAIDRKDAEDRLAHLAQFDSLTGLPNRHLFHDRLVQAMAQAKRTGDFMAVLFIDLDRFKLVNDTLGHAVGDQLLKEAATRLQRCVRASDTVGRLGGDEFSAILLDLAQPADASIVAQKIIDALGRPFQLEGHETYVSGSVGITLYPADGDVAATLIMNADAAMYRAKEQGRNNFQYFTREMNERALNRVGLESQLRRALERREFVLHYQPRVDLKSGALAGFEALLRWQQPDKGLVSPADFIPVLEDTGLITPVGEWVIRSACEQVVAWGAAGVPVLPVAINLSPRQFQQKDLETSVRRILQETGADPSLVQFEITETLIMKDPEAAARVLQGLNQSGVKLSVDDFGTGYSSLAYLKRFPLDALKIDRAFIRDIPADPEDAAITLAIINLAHTLGLQVIAEGVETEAQIDFLTRHGCDEMQGFYFSTPVAASECEAMMRAGLRLERVGRSGELRVA